MPWAEGIALGSRRVTIRVMTIGPQADGRPSPTFPAPMVSAEADTRREAPKGGDFNRPEQAVTEVTFLGRRPMVGLRRPFCSCADEGCRRRPTPGAKRPKRAISIGLNRYQGHGAQDEAGSRGQQETEGCFGDKVIS